MRHTPTFKVQIDHLYMLHPSDQFSWNKFPINIDDLLSYLDMTLTYRLTWCSHNVVLPSGLSSDSSSRPVH